MSPASALITFQAPVMSLVKTTGICSDNLSGHYHVSCQDYRHLVDNLSAPCHAPCEILVHTRYLCLEIFAMLDYGTINNQNVLSVLN